MENKKLKIACLHGFGTNKEFMKMQTTIFRKDYEHIADFIFLDAPYIVPYVMVTDIKVIERLETPPRSWRKVNISCNYSFR
jgi:hypothetical protein